jgi:hypothetical protein
MKKEVAEQVMAMVKTSIEELNKSIYLVQERCAPEELKAFRRGVGHALSEIHDRILNPILREHPDLLPKDVDYTPPPGPTLAEIGSKN